MSELLAPTSVTAVNRASAGPACMILEGGEGVMAVAGDLDHVDAWKFEK
jgi:hypothetical protein